MKLDFARIKEIKLVDVVARYKIPLRFKAEYAACCCPLPTHKSGDTQKSFSINLAGNYWRCFSESCNANNGGKRGGDCINFVALMDGISQLEAAKKLALWFGIAETNAPATTQTKTAEPIAQRSSKTQTQSSNQNDTTSSDSVKGYLHATRLWLDEVLLALITDEAGRKALAKEIMNRMYDSYQNGKKAKPTPT